ncbi:hypothetical protein FMZ60_07360 [Alcaligenaceae bacterium SJ-26]|nr:hypothetical protein FMZ60_07360 [Alcaligenaceae bacterium SJ-26]
MSKSILAVALMASVVSAHAAVIGGSTNTSKIDPKASTLLPFGADKPGLSINGSSIVINLEDGPIKHINQKYSNTPINSSPTQNVNGALNPKYLTLKDVNPVIGLFTNPTLGQVWYEKRAYDTQIYSVRQIADPAIPAAPKFGGLVIAKVPNLPAGTSVYFGEWAPRAGNPSTGSDTNLNLNSADHTVWYVGENPTGNTTGLATANYNVLGVNQHTPGQNDFYTGVLTAAFGSADPSLSGSLVRGSDQINFAGTVINNTNGTFAKGNEIKGQFYGAGAAALAGYTTRGTTDTRDDIAFGGRKQ